MPWVRCPFWGSRLGLPPALAVLVLLGRSRWVGVSPLGVRLRGRRVLFGERAPHPWPLLVERWPSPWVLSVRPSVRPPSAVRRPPPVRRLPPSPLWVWSGSGRLLLFSAAACLALPLLCSCCVPSLPFLLSACLLVPQASAPPWALYTATLSRLFQFLVRLRLNSAFLGTGLVGLLVQGRLRGQGEMPGPQ